MTKAEKRKRLLLAEKKLWELYPDAECALKHGGDPWRLLVMSRLSAPCTDKRVNEVSLTLFERFPDAASMAAADISEIEELVRPCGLYRTKAANIKDASRMLVEDYGGELPRDMDELLKFPGVGRKIANLLLGDLFGMPAIVCDTHCIRICGRLGMYPESLRDAVKIEKILTELFDISRGSDLCHRIVEFGRDICTARSPMCDSCPLAEICAKRERECRGK